MKELKGLSCRWSQGGCMDYNLLEVPDPACSSYWNWSLFIPIEGDEEELSELSHKNSQGGCRDCDLLEFLHPVNSSYWNWILFIPIEGVERGWFVCAIKEDARTEVKEDDNDWVNWVMMQFNLAIYARLFFFMKSNYIYFHPHMLIITKRKANIERWCSQKGLLLADFVFQPFKSWIGCAQGG